MKALCTVISLLLTSVTAVLADDPKTQVSNTNDPAASPYAGAPGTLLGVMRGADAHSLVIHYEWQGYTNTQVVQLSSEIAEYYACPWVFGRGVALAISDKKGEVYWAARFFAHLKKPVFPHRIPTPPNNRLIGIANTRGDTIVITGLDHSDEVTPRGWMYINSCPPAFETFTTPSTNAGKIQISGFDYLRTFEVPSKRLGTNQPTPSSR